MSYQSPIIVVGTGRSGTSVVAGMLHKLGIHMGDNFIPADNNNVAGTFEDVEFAKINPYLKVKDKREAFVKHTQNLVRVKGIQGRRWGWKMPDTAEVIDVYLDIDPNSKVIWCGRPLGEAIESCQRAYGWSEDEAKKLLYPRVEMLNKRLDGSVNVLNLRFDEVLSNPADTVDQLIAFTDIVVDEDTKKSAVEQVFDKNATKNARILVVCPSESLSLHASTHEALRKIASDTRYQVDLKILQGQPISHSRNKVAKKSVEDKYDFVLMIDDDVAPIKSPLDLVVLNKDILSLPTPIMQNGQMMFNTVVAVGDNFKPLPGHLQQGLVEIDAAGTGCILIKTDVFKKVKRPFDFEFDDDGLKTRGEDFAFCMRAKEAGFRVWTHYDYPCEHWNRLNMLQILEAFKKHQISC